MPVDFKVLKILQPSCSSVLQTRKQLSCPRVLNCIAAKKVKCRHTHGSLKELCQAQVPFARKITQKQSSSSSASLPHFKGAEMKNNCANAMCSGTVGEWILLLNPGKH